MIKEKLTESYQDIKKQYSHGTMLNSGLPIVEIVEGTVAAGVALYGLAKSLPKAWKPVSEGYKGVKMTLKKAGKILEPGPHFVFPLIQDVIQVDMRPANIAWEGEIEGLTTDRTRLRADITANISIGNPVDMVRLVGLDKVLSLRNDNSSATANIRQMIGFSTDSAFVSAAPHIEGLSNLSQPGKVDELATSIGKKLQKSLDQFLFGDWPEMINVLNMATDQGTRLQIGRGLRVHEVQYNYLKVDEIVVTAAQDKIAAADKAEAEKIILNAIPDTEYRTVVRNAQASENIAANGGTIVATHGQEQTSSMAALQKINELEASSHEGRKLRHHERFDRRTSK